MKWFNIAIIGVMMINPWTQTEEHELKLRFHEKYHGVGEAKFYHEYGRKHDIIVSVCCECKRITRVVDVDPGIGSVSHGYCCNCLELEWAKQGFELDVEMVKMKVEELARREKFNNA